MYGSELWGTFRTDLPKFRNGTIDLDQIYQTSSADSFHIKFCKYILGVHKKSSNFAVLSELGRSPLYFDTVRNILVYGNRLENISTTSNFKLLKDAYLLSKSLHEKGTASWYSSFNYLKDTLKITDQQFLVSIPKFKSSIKSTSKLKSVNIGTMIERN